MESSAISKLESVFTLKFIGKGTFGSVYKAECKLTGKIFAVKVMTRPDS